ncbi:MAG: hypothetical protein R3F54_23175 [Alphaproteobacteria bacterium]
MTLRAISMIVSTATMLFGSVASADRLPLPDRHAGETNTAVAPAGADSIGDGSMASEPADPFGTFALSIIKERAVKAGAGPDEQEAVAMVGGGGSTYP